MGFPVCVAGAEIVIKNIEALATYCETHRGPSNFSETLPLWLHYVDDTVTVHRNKINEFHENN